MSWVTWGQAMLGVVIVYVLVVSGITHTIEKRREDAIKRREAGL